MNKAIVSGLLVAMLSLTGCRSIPTVYQPAEPMVKTPVADSLLIANIVDARPVMDEYNFYSNADPYIFIPVLPYTTQTFSPVTINNYLESDLKESLLKLFVQDLRASGLFRHLSCADANNPDLKPGIGAYHLIFTINKGVWTRHLTAYCLSYAGTFLWGIGLPVSYGHVQLELVAELRNSQGQVLASETLSGQVTCTEWIFEQISYSPCVSEGVLTEIFPGMAEKLRKFLQKSIH